MPKYNSLQDHLWITLRKMLQQALRLNSQQLQWTAAKCLQKYQINPAWTFRQQNKTSFQHHQHPCQQQAIINSLQDHLPAWWSTHKHGHLYFQDYLHTQYHQTLILHKVFYKHSLQDHIHLPSNHTCKITPHEVNFTLTWLLMPTVTLTDKFLSLVKDQVKIINFFISSHVHIAKKKSHFYITRPFVQLASSDNLS